MSWDIAWRGVKAECFLAGQSSWPGHVSPPSFPDVGSMLTRAQLTPIAANNEVRSLPPVQNPQPFQLTSKLDPERESGLTERELSRKHRLRPTLLLTRYSTAKRSGTFGLRRSRTPQSSLEPVHYSEIH